MNQFLIRKASLALREGYSGPAELIVAFMSRDFRGLQRRKRFAVLQHRLSNIAQRSTTEPKDINPAILQSSLIEQETYYQFKERFCQSLKSGQAFFNFLSGIQASVSGAGNESYRVHPIATTADANNVRWIYPDASLIPTLMEELRIYLADSRDHDLVKATVAHVVFVCAHPFSDGNGRTSRVLFNLCMQRQRGFVPLKAFQQISMHGYEIRLRLCQLEGDWFHIVEFFCNVILAFVRAGKLTMRLR
ncbi:Fic family protein [Duganella radicis]|nr:Fic family protein [Duganella radicis]